jgi:RimJ/RimL family protein N-acetyltransferase
MIKAISPDLMVAVGCRSDSIFPKSCRFSAGKFRLRGLRVDSISLVGDVALAMKVIIETDRLFLREYVEDDAGALFRLNSDPEVLRFVPDKRLLNVEQARQILVDHPIADYRK